MISNQTNLKRGLALANHAVASRATLPILANIVLESKNGQLNLAGNNLEIGITTLVEGDSDDLTIAILAKLLIMPMRIP